MRRAGCQGSRLRAVAGGAARSLRGWALAASLCGLSAVGTARAEQVLHVVVAEPDAETCVQPDQLAAGVVNGGPFFVSRVSAHRDRPPASAAYFAFDGRPDRLRIRGWGLTEGTRAVDAAHGRDLPAELDRVLTGQSCGDVTEAVVALLVTLLEPPDRAAPLPARSPTSDPLLGLLERARSELSDHPELLVSVVRSDLDLTLVVEEPSGACRRGTWLSLAAGGVEQGVATSELRRHVLACARERRARWRAGVVSPEGPGPARGGESRASGFELPLITGALIAGAAAAGGLLVEEGYASVSRPVWLYAALPPIVGGLGGYLLPKRGREAAWLSGYWLGIAGGSLVAGVNAGGSHPVLVGGLLTAGSATSASLAVLSALASEESALPAWAIATPAVVGAGLAAAALLVEGSGARSSELVAAGGGMLSVVPALWLTLKPGPAGFDRALSVGARVGAERSLLLVRGEL